jgi:4-hydroxybenzoate polyprenyltransferase
LFYFIVRSHIFIALAAVALSLETQVQLGFKPQSRLYLLVIFFATLLAYNLQGWVNAIKQSNSKKKVYPLSMKINANVLNILWIISFIGFLISSLFIKGQFSLALLPLALITFFYSVPFIRINNRAFTLRDVPLLKIFLITGVWTCTTILLPLIQSDLIVSPSQICLLLIGRFLFVFSIAIQFDIRDMNADKNAGTKTLPVLIGKKTALKLSIATLLIFTIMCVIQTTNLKMYFLIPAFLISGISTLIFIVDKKIRETKYFHNYLLDGSLLLQGMLVCLCYYLN